ncbi:hypothetical protein U1Q18_051321 [Sarracenia purpurea var. burkii]
MANGKLTEGVANCYRQCPDAAPKKEQLDPERISKIKEYAKKHFDDMKKFNQHLHRAVQSSLVENTRHTQLRRAFSSRKRRGGKKNYSANGK